MVFVGETVDHRHARVAGKALDDVLLKRANHHHITHARNYLRRVFYRFAATELRIARVEINRRAAELLHAGFNESRVRVEAFSKIITSVRSAKGQ